MEHENLNRQSSNLEGGRRVTIDEGESDEEDYEEKHEVEPAGCFEKDVDEVHKITFPKSPERHIIRDSSPIRRGVIFEEIFEEKEDEEELEHMKQKHALRKDHSKLNESRIYAVSNVSFDF